MGIQGRTRAGLIRQGRTGRGLVDVHRFQPQRSRYPAGLKASN